MKTYSMDLRERVVAACDARTGTIEEVAARFSVSSSWVKKLLRLRRESGSFLPKPHGGGRVAVFIGERLAQLKNWVEEEPDATLEELLERSQVDASIMAVHRALERLGCRRKKSPSGRQSRIVPM
jgi:transposase